MNFENIKNENENENENKTLETFFNLLNPNNNIEHYSINEASQILSNINDAEINSGVQLLETSQKQIISKNNSIDELNNNTTLLYSYIYSIFITILVVIILGIITYLKNILNINENMYMILVLFVIISYICYIFYLFDIMYVKNSITKIITFFRTGRFEINSVTLGKLPASAYVQELCKKKKALKQNIMEDEDSESNMLKSGKYKAKIPNTTNNAYFYNDNNAPNLQYSPVVTNSKFSIINVDADNVKDSKRLTNRL